ncbi:hypothetical protein LCGC14_2369280 [marine sediment metagenome]|uniref:Lambda phage tail tube protein N-terminal domain-containing protein n=1 Tax=marine sediment metagenome TaxID=412755 RepID=A0A0F9EYY1_9ZZZZ
MTIAIDAHGTLLKLGDGGGGSEVFTTVAEVTDISGPSMTLDPIDVTSHDSTAAYREFIGGLLDAGEVTLTINYVPTAGTHDATTGLIADMVARVVRNFQLVFPDSGTTTWSFAALITAFEPAEPIDDKLALTSLLS